VIGVAWGMEGWGGGRSRLTRNANGLGRASCLSVSAIGGRQMPIAAGMRKEALELPVCIL